MIDLPLSPTVLVIFGITGNLSTHKLLPALYKLVADKRLPEQFFILGIFRDVPSLDIIFQTAEIEILRAHQECDPEVLAELRSKVLTLQMDSTNAEHFTRLHETLHKLNIDQQKTFNRLFYLAIPPQIFSDVITNLAQAGLNTQDEATGMASRILVEKPFGRDLDSAQALINHMAPRFSENQIYRIDHYLAKETAQNILTFRFNNPLVEGIWSRQFIDHIQITAAETIGIQGRVAFYEQMGALRDIVQSHLMQLMALVMMEYPEGLTSHAIHREKLLLLESIELINPQHVEEVASRGQYQGYPEEVSNPKSHNETYAAVKLEVANTRWGGVPILLRTGKGLADKRTDITVVFKDRTRREMPDNLLIIRIQPNEGISLKLLAKQPGFSDTLQPVLMDFMYQGSFEGPQPDAYQRVLIDAIRGDQSLFATSEEVLASWRLLQPVIDYWETSDAAVQSYPKGSWGPDTADQLAHQYGCQWQNGDDSQPEGIAR
jgi:glucose-6-phosphate 1-dehydrogenase